MTTVRPARARLPLPRRAPAAAPAGHVRSRTRRGALAAALLLALAGLPALAPAARAQEVATFVVESPTLRTGRPMPRDYAPDGRNVSPPLTWRGLPDGTRELVVICQDHGAGNPPPWVHWVVYNVPATVDGLPEGIPFDPSDPMPAGLEGVAQGNNSWGLRMYRGPAPPEGSLHHYDFTVLALDAELDLPPGLTRAEVLEAARGHVIGEGHLVPVYRRQPANAEEP
ncbi:MAG TPA: YbhB/YbcL family Raf kinase inhibitor-like protein [Longimicrobiales bacterium]|nr:YbhB/YbcL family Raf kinase inhibitor-like protein [Longimicrobiales bacterium]